MKTLLQFPFKFVYFFIRWTGYVLLWPFGIFSLLRRHGKKRRENTQADMRKILGRE